MLTLGIAFSKAEQKTIVTARLIATNSLRQAGYAKSLLHNLQDIFVIYSSFCQTIQQSMSDSMIKFLIERKFIIGLCIFCPRQFCSDESILLVSDNVCLSIWW